MICSSPNQKFALNPTKNITKWRDKSRKKWGHPVGEEPIFFLTYPGTKLQILWCSKKYINLNCSAEKEISPANLQKRICFIFFDSVKVFL